MLLCSVAVLVHEGFNELGDFILLVAWQFADSLENLPNFAHRSAALLQALPSEQKVN